MRWAGYSVRLGEILVGRHAWRRPPRRRHRWEADMNIYLREIGPEVVD
jgi:hypothetical protein